MTNGNTTHVAETLSATRTQKNPWFASVKMESGRAINA